MKSFFLQIYSFHFVIENELWYAFLADDHEKAVDDTVFYRNKISSVPRIQQIKDGFTSSDDVWTSVTIGLNARNSEVGTQNPLRIN